MRDKRTNKMKGINWIAVFLLTFLLVTSTQLTISPSHAIDVALSALIYTLIVLLVLLVVFVAGVMFHAHEVLKHKLPLPQGAQSVPQTPQRYSPAQIETRVYPVPDLITDPELIKAINNAIA